MSLLLVSTIFLPLVGAVALAVIANRGRALIRLVALAVTLLTLVGAAMVVASYPADGVLPESGAHAAADLAWISGASGGGASGGGAADLSVPSRWLPDIRFRVGLDGLGVWMYGLAALLMVTAVLVSWEAIEDRPALFYGMLLLLESGCLGVFAARDLLLFYIFFEFTLIPLFFLIGIWGSEQRRYAAIKFFLFTLAGSVLTFLGMLAIVLWDARQTGAGLRFSIPDLTAALAIHPLPVTWQIWIFLALFAGFAIKVPLFPLHTWLPLAHVQAPTAGSVILAGVLLKIGTYGFVRFNLPLLPEASAFFMPAIMTLSVAGIVYGALVALAQSDIKRLIAYSSVSHLGYCMLGLFALNPLGMQGGVLQMVNHGLSTGGLFALVGMLYERYHTREIAQYGGLAARLPKLSCLMLLFTFSSIGLPGLNGFAGEFLILIGTFQRAMVEAAGGSRFLLQVVAVVAVSGVVLGAWYMLSLVRRVFFGPWREPAADGHHADAPRDLTIRELAALLPLVIFVFWIGLAPDYFLRRMAPTLDPIAATAARPLHLQSLVRPETAAVQPSADRLPAQLTSTNAEQR
ncbi:MAG: NuoM family protein [Planctomycetota bacterium]